MSGLAGIFHLDGRDANLDMIRRMVAAMPFHGDDAFGYRCQGTAALGHRHFWTTPEDQGETQPLTAAGGRFWLVANARIDNRAELIPQLAAKSLLAEATPSDAAVILAAYLAWGEDCVQHLLGDFVFVVWDGRERELFAARDPVGLKPLYYAQQDGAVYFGSTIGAVLAGLPHRPKLDRTFIEAFLWSSYDLFVCQTPYEGLRRLPPAHTLSATSDGVGSTRLYYVFGQQPSPGYRSDDEWVAGFRAVLDQAIRCRLRSRTPVAVAVSGGLDSSSLACAAYELCQQDGSLPEVRLYSTVFENTPSADERAYFDAVVEQCRGISATPIVSDGAWALSEFGDDKGYPLEEPELYTLRAHTLAILRPPAADGCRVVFFGEGGDGLMGNTLYYQRQSWRSIPLRQRWKETRWYRLQESWPKFLARHYLSPVTPLSLKLRLAGPQAQEMNARPWLPYPRPTLADDVCVAPADVHPPGLSRWADELFSSIVHRAHFTARLSMLDTHMAFCGLEWRTPYLDVRLIEIMLHAPLHLLSWGGVDRILLRESMRGTLPEKVRTRSNKTSFSALDERGLEKERERMLDLLDSSRGGQLGFVRSDVLRETFDKFLHDPDTFVRLFNPLKLTLCLEAWLRASGD